MTWGRGVPGLLLTCRCGQVTGRWPGVMPERLVEFRYGPAPAAVVLLVVLLAGSGCSAAAPERVDAPSTPPVLRAPSPSPPDPVSAARQAALAAYAGMWAAYDEAGRAPQADPDHPALAQFVTRDALEGLRTGLGRLRERGLVFEGGYALTAPEVVDLDPPDVGGPAFSGQSLNSCPMLRSAGSGTRRGPLAGSCSRVPSGDVSYCRTVRCNAQHPSARVLGSGTVSDGPARSSKRRKTIPLKRCHSRCLSARPTGEC